MENIVGKRILMLACFAGLVFCATSAMAQSNPKKSFRFPTNITPADYEHQSVLVKVKPEHRETFRGRRNVSGLTQASGITGTRSLIPERAAMNARAKQGPRRSQSSTDFSLYHRINCAPGTNIEDFINALYQTGYFELVEPEYTNHLTYTPNDPLLGSQYYLNTIRAKEAWDLTHGNTNITIAIVDSGGDLVHEDLAANLRILADDPTDGIDNDGNTWIDDNRGWDFVGSTASNIDDPLFEGDNNPQLLAGGNAAHGVSVGGCASAVPDNAKGIAGVGFETKLLFTKHSPDDEPDGLSIYRGYDGIIYAALSGADIINISWGGSGRSEIIQVILTAITEEYGVLIVAAAGNTPIEAPFYPAAYDNVFSVAGTTSTNGKASFSTFGSFVDICAPAVGISTTAYGSNYTSTQGTSFSSPIAAGAAALVMAQFPTYTPQQVAEQLRVSANPGLIYNANPSLVGKMGFGILDVYNALTLSSPSVRASKPQLLNANGSPAQAGEAGFLTMTFTNLLASTSSALEITITENSPYVSIQKGMIRPGVIPEGGSITNTLAPFEVQIAASVPDNVEIRITVLYSDGVYQDRQEITFLMNPTFIDVDENLVTTTVSNTGRIGFEDPEAAIPQKGSGFLFNGIPILYEMGVMMGTGTGTQLFNNVRSVNSGFDQDFVSIGSRISEITPGLRSSSEISGTISNSTAAAAQVFQMKYRSLAWREEPYDKFVIMEYTIKNPTATAINNFYIGIFSDWDVTENGIDDIAKYDSQNKLGYVYANNSGGGLPHAGIQLLTGTGFHYAIDNNQANAGVLFGLYDGFTDAEKFQTLTTNRPEGGVVADGTDVSHVLSAGPLSIPAGQEIVVAFALHAALNLDDLKTSAQYADTAYNYMLPAPKPVVPETSACYGSGSTFNASGATTFKWYRDFTGGTAFHTGSSFTTGNLENDTTFYVSNAEESYESVRTAAIVNIKANPTILTSGSTAICDNEILTLGVAEADTYLWSNGETTQTIQVNQPGNYSVAVTSISPVCSNSSTPITVTNIPSPVAGFSMNGELKTFLPIDFIDESVDATSWDWDFGNDITSTDQNPTVTFTDVGPDPFDVTLVVRASNGCRDTLVQSIELVTAIDEVPDKTVSLFPNPSRGLVYIDLADGYTGPRSVELTTLQGRMLYQRSGITGSRLELSMHDLPDGIYLVRVETAAGVVNKKVVRIH